MIYGSQRKMFQVQEDLSLSSTGKTQKPLDISQLPHDKLLEVINLVVVKGDGLLDVVPLDSSVWFMQGGLHHEEFITAGR